MSVGNRSAPFDWLLRPVHWRVWSDHHRRVRKLLLFGEVETDGGTLVFGGGRAGMEQLYLRRLDELQLRRWPARKARSVRSFLATEMGGILGGWRAEESCCRKLRCQNLSPLPPPLPPRSAEDQQTRFPR